MVRALSREPYLRSFSQPPQQGVPSLTSRSRTGQRKLRLGDWPTGFSEGCGRALSCGQEGVISTARVHSPHPGQHLPRCPALCTCHVEAVRVAVRSVDSGLVSWLHPSTRCVALADFPSHSVPRAFSSAKWDKDSPALLGLLRIYHSACPTAPTPSRLVLSYST